MEAPRHDRAKKHRRDQKIDRAIRERESADSHERLRKLRLMLGEASGPYPARWPPVDGHPDG